MRRYARFSTFVLSGTLVVWALVGRWGPLSGDSGWFLYQPEPSGRITLGDTTYVMVGDGLFAVTQLVILGLGLVGLVTATVWSVLDRRSHPAGDEEAE